MDTICVLKGLGLSRVWKSLFVVFAGIAVAGILLFGLLIWRGVRATLPPSAFETLLARSVRNLAIPRSEGRSHNPLQGDSEALRAGREDFLARCAICHGVDGSGKTPIGLGLYPRVPDLREAKTQDLTDGEIHYIIENGVQLTGMPAWGNPHREPSNDSWKLALFIRSLKPLAGVELSQQAHTISSAHYVGSQACAKCHAQIYERWRKTPMANVVRDPQKHPDAIIPDLATNDVYKFTKEQVAFVYGSIWKQRYFTKIGDAYFPLPVQWSVGERKWLRYFVPAQGADFWGRFYPADNMQRPTGPLCDGCHSVGYDIHTKQVAEWNVGCERCHGPGSEHADHPARGNVLSPANMTSVASTDTCIQCHSQGRPLNNPIEGKYYDWPVGYQVGLRLPDYWRLENCTLGQPDFYYFPDCTAHKNRMQGNDFVQSVMYQRGITCSSCHDAHGTENYAQLRKPPNQLCFDCHGPMSPNGPRSASIEAHTHHKSGTPGSQCVDCHMPRIETEGVPGAYVHAHTFRFVSPAMTDKYNIPNPCTSCHVDKSTEWARDAMGHWPERSAWRLQ